MTSTDSPATRRRPGQATRRARGRHAPDRDPAREILAAAARLLEGAGLEDLAVSDIIAEADIARTTFYMYFESKHSVIGALAQATVTEVFLELWEPLFTRTWPVGPAEVHLAREQLTDMFGETFRRWRDNRSLMLAAGQGSRAHPGAYSGWNAVLEHHAVQVTRHIEDARTSGVAPPGPPAALLASLLMWLAETAMHRALAGDDTPRASDEELSDALATVYLRTIYSDIP